MQPSLTKPPMSGDETATPTSTQLPPLSPELPTREQEPAPPITETPPKTKANRGRILLPKALVDDLYREARKNFALIPDMTFALAAGSRTLRDMWDHKDGEFLRKERLFANYIPPKEGERGASLRDANLGTTAIEAARARWDEAKHSGDPDRITRTANDLLRAVETGRTSHGEPDSARADHSRHPIDDALSPRGAKPQESAQELPVRTSDLGETPSALDSHAGHNASEGLAEHAHDRETHHFDAIAERPGDNGADSPVQHAVFPDEQSTPLTKVALSPQEESFLAQDENRFNPSTSWDWAAPEPGAPYRVANFLRRMGFRKDRWRDLVDQPSPHDRRRRDWANPDYGWRTNQTTLNLLEMGRHGSLTIETLLMLSDAAYWDRYAGDSKDIRFGMPDAFEDMPAFFEPDSGWERIGARDSKNGYGALALYNRNTNTVIVVNRGTRLSVNDALTDKAIFDGLSPRSFDAAQNFLREVVWKWMGDYGHRNAQVILTGHSLGGAYAQLQLALAHRDSTLQGMKAFSVTFAALGARDAIVEHLNRRAGIPTVPEDLDQFARTRTLNFARAGDGFPHRGAVYGRRSVVLGNTEELGGLYMGHIRRFEEQTRRYGFLAIDDQKRLAELYYENHKLRSFHRHDFTIPLGQALKANFRSRRLPPPAYTH